MQGRPDIAVVGAGATGLAAAIALAREGFQTTLIGEPPRPAPGRTVALLDASVALLTAIEAWPDLAPVAAPMATMRIVDATGNLFAAPPLTFHAAEIGLPAFGHNIENAALIAALTAIAGRTPNLTVLATLVDRAEPVTGGLRLTLADGRVLTPTLVAAADGRSSRIREAVGIEATVRTYRQSAVAAIFAHTGAHRDTSTELHTRGGPFTLVPMTGRRSSLVWVCPPYQARRLARLSPEEFARAAEGVAQSMLGGMTLEGERSVVPLSALSVERFAAPGTALVGEAAHVFPPIGAQGLNLALRDVAALRDAVVDARRRGVSIADPGVLAAYGRGRRFDATTRGRAIDALNRSLLTTLLPVDLARGAGMLALGLAGPLRRLVMREGLAPRLGLPRLMRDRGADIASSEASDPRHGGGLDAGANLAYRTHIDQTAARPGREEMGQGSAP